MGRPSSAFGWAVVLTLFGSACHERVPTRRDAELSLDRTVEIVARTPSIATYPCGEQCHDARLPNPTPRELSLFHAGRRIQHGPAVRWCDRCHDLDDLDHLRMMDGDSVSFDASDQICGQCHGEKHRDWSAGVHGSITGGWAGTARRQLCTGCHDPHVASRIHLEALPPPTIEPRLTGGSR